jgi:ribonuclease P protein component
VKIGRLRTAEEFQSVYKTGRASQSPSFTVRVASSDGPAAFGFVVSTKVSKSAVARNRIRRRVREFVRRNADDITAGVAVAVIAKGRARELSSAETNKELSSLFKQATLIR